MSQTPPERDADSPAPGGSGNPWLRFLGWAMLALVLYVLSTGLAWWLVKHDYLTMETFDIIYTPIWALPFDLIDMVEAYMSLWAPIHH